jgi:hypothetical protein
VECTTHTHTQTWRHTLHMGYEMNNVTKFGKNENNFVKRHSLKDSYLHMHCRENRGKERISTVTDYDAKISSCRILNLCLFSNGKTWWVYAIKLLTVFLLQLYRLGILASSGSELSRTPLRV